MKKITAFGETKTLFVKKDTSLNDSKPVFGIDLGTTNSAISIIKDGRYVETIKLKNGKYTMPSCVWFHHNKFIVGDEAYRNRDKEDSVVYSVKRLMQDTKATVTLRDGNETITMTPAEVSAEILKGLVEHTEGMYGKVEDVVVTVPAYFEQSGIDATRKACELAGLNLIGIANEPTAASLCYDIKPEDGNSKDIIVYDLGGGTFDVTLARITMDSSVDDGIADLYGLDSSDEEEPSKVVTTLFVDGDAHLGGDDIDLKMLDILYTKIREAGVDPDKFKPDFREKLLLDVECFKKDDVHCMYEVPINTINTDGISVKCKVTLIPDDFRVACDFVYQKTKRILKRVLKSKDNNASNIVLVGGSTKNPWLLEALRKDFPSYQIDNALNPDLAVSNGAAIQGKIMKFGDASVSIFDVMPIAIGILDDGLVRPLIKRGSSLPCVESSVFTTTVDNQEVVSVKLYQGNSDLPEECTYLGQLVLDGIEKKAAGEPNLSVSISISADRLMKCSASIDGIKKELKLNLAGETTQSTQLSREEKKKLRWMKLSKKMSAADSEKFVGMVEGYPDSVSAEEIMVFIKGLDYLVKGISYEEYAHYVSSSKLLDSADAKRFNALFAEYPDSVTKRDLDDFIKYSLAVSSVKESAKAGYQALFSKYPNSIGVAELDAYLRVNK